MLVMFANERQDDWHAQLPHVDVAYNISVNATTGFAPNEVYMGRLPLPPLTTFEQNGVARLWNLPNDQLDYCN